MNKSTRLNQELIYLNSKEKFQLIDLMNAFNISKRTALRDIESLEALGLPLYSEAGRYGGYHILDTKILPPLYFSYEEITSIFFALKALEKLYINPFNHPYPSIFQKLMTSLSKDQQKNVLKNLEVTHYYNASPLQPAKFLPEILDSIINEKQVSLTYSQHGFRKLELQFFDIYYREGVWFSHAVNIQTKEWGVFRCDFIQSFDLLNTTQSFSHEEMNQMLECHEKTFRTIYFQCQISLFGKELFQKNHYETMEIKNIHGKDYLTGYYNPKELDYLVHYLIEFGEHITIENPSELKNAYLNSLKRIIDRY